MKTSQVVSTERDNGDGQTDVSKIVLARLQISLNSLLSDCSDIAGVMISGYDGHAWVQHLHQGLDPHRFAAMSSALLALSDSLIQETHSGATKSVLLESDGGNILVIHAGDNLLLTVFTRKGSNIGMSLAFAKKTADEIKCFDLNE